MYPRFSQTFIANEIAELERQGCEVHILSLRKPTDGVFHEAVCRVKARAEYLPESHHGQWVSLLRSHWNCFRRSPAAFLEALRILRRDATGEWYDLARAVEVLRWVKKKKLDHVHVHFGTSEATVALLAHALGGMPYSITLHAFDIFRDNVNRPLLARKINHSCFTVTVTEFNRRYMLENLPGLVPERVQVNYNGIALDRFAVPRAPDEKPLLFSLGRLIEKKGFAHLIRAVARLRDQGLHVRCKIGGTGPDAAALEEMIASLKLESSVELVGALGERGVLELLGRATCFVLPCVQAADGNVDALPTVLLEAQAAGCPVITTRLSGNPEIVEDRVSGLLVEPGDDAALALAIRDVVTDPDLACSLAAGGRRRAEERFDARRNVEVMHEWFRRAGHAAGHGRRPEKHAAAPLAVAVGQG
jgi:glycosyltransferase involved in cell wall biosynthesis